ncbi:hypothetical protein Tco_1263715 [Tanacetum coccineum]
MAQDNGYAFVEVQEDGTKTICIDYWFEAQPGHEMSFDTRPKPDREAMWVHCEMHHSRMSHTTTKRYGCLGVQSTTVAGLAGGSVATGTITVVEVIDDYISPQHSSKDETDPPATQGTRLVMSSSTVTYISISYDSDLPPWGFHLISDAEPLSPEAAPQSLEHVPQGCEGCEEFTGSFIIP